MQSVLLHNRVNLMELGVQNNPFITSCKVIKKTSNIEFDIKISVRNDSFVYAIF